MNNPLKEIMNQPTVFTHTDGSKIDETIFKSNGLLSYVYCMAKRGDSAKSIVDVIDVVMNRDDSQLKKNKTI